MHRYVIRRTIAGFPRLNIVVTSLSKSNDRSKELFRGTTPLAPERLTICFASATYIYRNTRGSSKLLGAGCADFCINKVSPMQVVIIVEPRVYKSTVRYRYICIHMYVNSQKYTSSYYIYVPNVAFY